MSNAHLDRMADHPDPGAARAVAEELAALAARRDEQEASR